MGIKNDNYYRLTHRQRGQDIPDRGVRLHNGRRAVDVEDLFSDAADKALEAAALTGLGAFIQRLRLTAPKVYAASTEADAFDDLRALFLDARG
jgi:hypothetical protein